MESKPLQCDRSEGRLVVSQEPWWQPSWSCPRVSRPQVAHARPDRPFQRRPRPWDVGMPPPILRLPFDAPIGPRFVVMQSLSTVDIAPLSDRTPRSFLADKLFP